MKINGKIFDRALMMCANDDDKDYTEVMCLYRDFKKKNYKYNKSTRALQLQFLTEHWGKLEEKCPHLMYNYNLLVDLWLHPKDEKQRKKITNIYKLYGYDGDLRLSKDLERIIFY